MLLEVSDSVLMNSAEVALNDPNGVVITVVSVMVVFLSLVILYLAYGAIGKLSTHEWGLPFRKKSVPSSEGAEPDDEIAAVIAFALRQHLDKGIHDDETYIITIRRNVR